VPGGAQPVLRIGRGARRFVIDPDEDAATLAGGVGDARQRRFDQRATGGATCREISCERRESGLGDHGILPRMQLRTGFVTPGPAIWPVPVTGCGRCSFRAWGRAFAGKTEGTKRVKRLGAYALTPLGSCPPRPRGSV